MADATPSPPATSPPQQPDIDSLWNYSDPAATEVTLRKLLERVGDTVPLAWRLELLTQLARTQSLQRKWYECHQILDHVEKEVTNEMPRVRVRLRLERGRAFNDVGRFDEAKRCFNDAWTLAEADRIDALAVDAAHMLGMMDPPEVAIEWNRRALAFAQGSTDPAARKWVGTLKNNLAGSTTASTTTTRRSNSSRNSSTTSLRPANRAASASRATPLQRRSASWAIRLVRWRCNST